MSSSSDEDEAERAQRLATMSCVVSGADVVDIAAKAALGQKRPNEGKSPEASIANDLPSARVSSGLQRETERRLDALNHDERDLRRPPHTTVPVYCDRTTPERRNLNGRGRRGPGAGKATMGDDWSRKIAMDPTQWWYGMDRDHPLG